MIKILKILILLILPVLPCIAQEVPSDSLFRLDTTPPIRFYNLRYEDAILVSQLSKVIGTSRKCPACVKRKEKSRVYFALMVADTNRVVNYFEDTGKLVAAPYTGEITCTFYCSKADAWREVRKNGKKIITMIPYTNVER